MTHRRILTLAAFFGATALLAGCIDTDSSLTAGSDDPGSEEQAIQNVLFGDMKDYAEIDVRYYQDDPGGASAAPINTHFWRRELLNFDRVVEIVINDPGNEPPTASVTLTGYATGLLHLWGCESDSLVEVVKDFDDSGVRSLFFERRGRPTDDPHRGWRLTAISGAEISSEATTRTINSVRVQAEGVDRTFTGVSELIALPDILRLPRESEVTVTVDTGDATDAVFLHVRRHGRRLELENNGDGTFTGRYWTGFEPGPRHAVVDVLSNGTLYDDQEAYDNIAWGIPYVIEGDRPLP